jgi:ribosomal protein S12 methylthiotransferase accessory factor
MDNSVASNVLPNNQLPIVFLGPSIARDEACEIVTADFRPPCRRGDLAQVTGGALIGLIDGVFDQNDAISPRELFYALERGVTILGSSSMGALRAVEVPGIYGIGRIYEMYKNGVIDSDDEVALLFDPDRLVPLTVPLVNVRYAVERLVQSGSITSSVSERILKAAQQLHYRDRTYKRILAEAGLGEKVDAEDLLNLLVHLDLKKDDAKLLLERLNNIQHAPSGQKLTSAVDSGSRPDYGPQDNFSSFKAPVETRIDAPVLIWEMGDLVPFVDLVTFLKMTGKYELHARNASVRLLVEQPPRIEVDYGSPNLEQTKQDLRRLCFAWGWRTREEINVTMNDLGLGLNDIQKQLRDESAVRSMVSALACNPTPAFINALRCELFFNDIALKREAMRYGSLKRLAAIGVSGEAADSAKKMLCRIHHMPSWHQLRKHLVDLGVTEPEIHDFVAMLTSASLAAESLNSTPSMPNQNQEGGYAADKTFGLHSSPKAPGDQRFCLPIAQAYEQLNRVKDVIRVTRVGMITGLTEMEGVHVSQVARPDGAWSSSYGSGKSDTKEGAIVGGILEETEKWAQERFKGEPTWSSYGSLRREENALDPQLLDLPHDSIYDDNLEFAWHKCVDLIDGCPIFVPLAAVTNPFNCGKNNILYSKRAARVLFTTNGLASGFTLAEAMVHSACELIERHAAKMSELRVENPGLEFSNRLQLPRKIDMAAMPDNIRSLTERLTCGGYSVRVWDIISEVRVPTFLAWIVKNGRIGRGWATHPNPAVATHMAILEAAQTVAGSVAGGREDLTVKARSLGRHERPIPLRNQARLFWEDEAEAPTKLAEIHGMIADDAYTELNWVRQMIIAAGIKHMIAVNLSRDEVRPVHVVRVILPGLETNNPYYCGPRARMALISDLLC